MAKAKSQARAGAGAGAPGRGETAPVTKQVRAILARLKRVGSPRVRDEMEPRYGIVAPRAFGVPVGTLRKLAAELGPSHELAEALWQSGWYEARLLAAFVDEPDRVTPAQMDRWCHDFDNWAVVDTVCFHLFDRTPHALAKVSQWHRRREEFVRRAAFALLACVALHDRRADEARLATFLPLIEGSAADERNLVKKAVSWALRSIGRRSGALREPAMQVARRLADSDDAAARWVGRDALRDLAKVKPPRTARAR